MKKSNQNINYLSYLKCEYDRICETPDKTIKEASYRSVCDEMFNSLLNNITNGKTNSKNQGCNNHCNKKSKSLRVLNIYFCF